MTPTNVKMKKDLDKRTHGYKRRIEALLKKPDAVVKMLVNAIIDGFSAAKVELLD